MTAFIKDNLPSDVNTVEGVLYWAACVLQNVNPTKTAYENASTQVLTCQMSEFPVNTDAGLQWRGIMRFSMPLDSNYRQGGQLWDYVQPLSSTAIPTKFTQANA